MRPADSGREETLRVLTFNTWMVPLRGDRASLPTRVARAVAALDVDVVGFQEVWRESDARALSQTLTKVGYRWTQWRAADGAVPLSSPGLMIASRHPLRDATFSSYDAGDLPLVLWQPDWLSNKGFLAADVVTPAGTIRFFTTHAQADYPSHDYICVRTHQMVQLARAVRDVQLPVVVAGDVNVRRGELGRRALVAVSGLTEVTDHDGVDAVFFRNSEEVSIREVGSQRVDVTDHAGRLSDHDAVLVVLRLDRAPAHDDRREHAEFAVGGLFLRIASQALLAFAIFVSSILCLRRLRNLRVDGWRWKLPRAGAIVVAGMVALWCLYFAVLYTPARARWLADATHDLPP